MDSRELRSYEEIAHLKGFYYNTVTHDLYKNNGRIGKATRRIIQEHDFGQPIFLLVTADLDMSQAEVKQLAAERYGLDPHAIGKVVDNDD